MIEVKVGDLIAMPVHIDIEYVKFRTMLHQENNDCGCLDRWRLDDYYITVDSKARGYGLVHLNRRLFGMQGRDASIVRIDNVKGVVYVAGGVGADHFREEIPIAYFDIERCQVCEESYDDEELVQMENFKFKICKECIELLKEEPCFCESKE